MIPSRGTADLIEATTQRQPLFDQLFLEAAPICKLLFDVQLSTFMEDRDATARISSGPWSTHRAGPRL